MLDYLPFSDDSYFDGGNFFGGDNYDGEFNYQIIIFLILFCIVIWYFYFVVYKKYKSNTNKKFNDIKKTSTEKINLINNVLKPEDLTQFTDSKAWSFENECKNTECPDLSCDENEIILRKRDKCCGECIKILKDDTDKNINFEKRLNQLNKFVNKNLKKNNIDNNLSELGKNTANVTFSLIDKVSNFNYSNFNLESFISIFTNENKIIYVGLILLFLGLFLTLF